MASDKKESTAEQISTLSLRTAHARAAVSSTKLILQASLMDLVAQRQRLQMAAGEAFKADDARVFASIIDRLGPLEIHLADERWFKTDFGAAEA